MKRIQLTDGQPISVRKKDLKPKTNELVEVIKIECEKSGLSYVEINKALHVADEELYINTINKSQKFAAGTTTKEVVRELAGLLKKPNRQRGSVHQRHVEQE